MYLHAFVVFVSFEVLGLKVGYINARSRQIVDAEGAAFITTSMIFDIDTVSVVSFLFFVYVLHVLY